MEEKKIIGMPDPITIEKTKQILNQMRNCICKIKINEIIGTGFFCNINYNNVNNNFLITNYHIINDDLMKTNKYITITINDDNEIKKIDIDNERKNLFK